MREGERERVMIDYKEVTHVMGATLKSTGQVVRKGGLELVGMG